MHECVKKKYSYENRSINPIYKSSLTYLFATFFMHALNSPFSTNILYNRFVSLFIRSSSKSVKLNACKKSDWNMQFEISFDVSESSFFSKISGSDSGLQCADN